MYKIRYCMAVLLGCVLLNGCNTTSEQVAVESLVSEAPDLVIAEESNVQTDIAGSWGSTQFGAYSFTSSIEEKYKGYTTYNTLCHIEKYPAMRGSGQRGYELVLIPFSQVIMFAEMQEDEASGLWWWHNDLTAVAFHLGEQRLLELVYQMPDEYRILYFKAGANGELFGLCYESEGAYYCQVQTDDGTLLPLVRFPNDFLSIPNDDGIPKLDSSGNMNDEGIISFDSESVTILTSGGHLRVHFEDGKQIWMPDGNAAVLENGMIFQCLSIQSEEWPSRYAMRPYHAEDTIHSEIILDIEDQTMLLALPWLATQEGAVVLKQREPQLIVTLTDGRFSYHMNFDTKIYTIERSYTIEMLEERGRSVSEDGRLIVSHTAAMAVGGAWCDEVIFDTQTREINYLLYGYCDMVFGPGYELFVNDSGRLLIYDAMSRQAIVDQIVLSGSNIVINGVCYDKQNQLYLLAATNGSEEIGMGERDKPGYALCFGQKRR